MRKFLFPDSTALTASIGLLVVRLIFGLALAQHGWSKIQNPFGWMGPESQMPGFLQALAALSEFGGGVAIAFGFLTPLAALGVICTMAVAVWTHASKGGPWVSMDGGSYESALGYLAVGVAMLLTGPGLLSVDGLIFNRRKRTGNIIAGK